MWLRDLLEKTLPWLNYPLFRLGESAFTLGTFLYLVITLYLLFFLSEKMRQLIVRRILAKSALTINAKQTIGSILKYSLLIIGLMVILQSTGLDLSTLGLIAGALGVGIGFGLQNITSNFISGLIILFEKPVKVGDRIEVGKITGNIIRISARATTVVTNDNIAIIIPNSYFINDKVTNWSLNDRNVRFNFPVHVSYKEDPHKIKKILLEVALENPGVLKHPKPDVLFDSYGDSSLEFILRVWTSEFSDNPNVLKSKLYYSIFEKFKSHQILIPYPQRDIHLVSGFGKIGKDSEFGKRHDSNKPEEEK
jgi:small-conductance mechanosensitive channel